MTKQELIQKYPKIFLSEDVDPRYPFPMFGIECNDGWLPLLDRLCSNLQWNTDKNNSEGKYPQIKVTQCKEKFGGLRFYVQGATEHQYGMIDLAESLSYHICEDCGKFSEKQLAEDYYGWIYTKCDDCKAKMIHNKSREKTNLAYIISFKSTWWFKKYIIKKEIQKLRYKIKTLYNKFYEYLFTFKR